MAFDPAFLDELRMRVPLADVVGRRVKLVKKGREHSGLCPFHNEKTPSFTVNEDKGFFHCFGCGAHGDVIGFVMRTENLSFPEAIEKLAEEVGLEMPRQTRESREQLQVRHTLHAVLEAATQWFRQQLDGPHGQAAKDYLLRRGLGQDVLNRFRIGFAPEARGALKAALTKQGFTEQLLIEAGLLRRRDEGGDTYDLFRNRIIFPITDRRSRVIAFGGRVLDPAPEGAPKYLNSPETSVFHKGRTLYGLAEATEGARKEGKIVVAEGYMDAIALASIGIPTVAPLGTALTEDQLTILWKLSPEPILCFDGDAAGRRASDRAINRALPLLTPGKTLYLMQMPEGEDPDSFARKRGKKAVELLISRAKRLSEAIWEGEISTRAIVAPEDISLLENNLINRAKTIADPISRSSFLSYFQNKVWENYKIGRRLRPEKGKKKKIRYVIEYVVSEPDPLFGLSDAGDTESREGNILATLISHPNLIYEFDEQLTHLTIFVPEFDSLLRRMIQIAAANDNPEPLQIAGRLSSFGMAHTVDALTYARGSFSRFLSLSDEEARWGLTEAIRRQSRYLLQAELDELVETWQGNDVTVLDRIVSIRTFLNDEDADPDRLEEIWLKSEAARRVKR